MMTLPKLPTTSSQISEANKIRKTGQHSTADWLLQDSKSKFSTSSISPLSSGMNSMENSFPKMSNESSSSNFSEVNYCLSPVLHNCDICFIRNTFLPRRMLTTDLWMPITSTLKDSILRELSLYQILPNPQGQEDLPSWNHWSCGNQFRGKRRWSGFMAIRGQRVIQDTLELGVDKWRNWRREFIKL